MQIKNILLFIAFLATALTGQAQFRTETGYLTFDGLDRSYELFVPDNYSPEMKYPLVLILHGGGGKAQGLVRTTRARFNQLANRDGFIAVYPNGFEKSWNDGARDTLAPARKLNIDDVGFINALIIKLEKQLSINREQIYACGISNGGFMAQRLAYDLSDNIKGIGVVAANLSEVQSQKPFPEHPVPAIFINGTDDPLMPYQGGYITVFRQKRGKVLSIEKTIETWKKIDSCAEKISETPFPDINKRDGCTAVKTTWRNPKNIKTKVVAIKVEGGGHTWPGTNQYLPRKLVGNTNRDFNGCDEIWNFFQSIQAPPNLPEKEE
ncbi:MAG TPA: PHB depolymerase family esterase [Draconibacterium sp.]|nr:PHB depolymerase family esterase [Draconibacterium sp.]